MDVADTMLDHFWDPGEGGLFTTPDDGEPLIVRQKDLFDNATPSANSTAAVALVPPRRAHRRAALRQPRRPDPAAPRPARAEAPSGFTNVARRASPCARRASPRSRSSATAPTCVAVVRERWRPDVVLAWGERYDSPLWEGRVDGLAYVCQHFACQAPQYTPEGLRGQLAVWTATRSELGTMRQPPGSTRPAS